MYINGIRGKEISSRASLISCTYFSKAHESEIKMASAIQTQFFTDTKTLRPVVFEHENNLR